LEHLRQEIRAFPSEFLLFQSVPIMLQLNDGVDPERELRVEGEGKQRVLVAGGERSRWRLEKDDVRITDSRAIGDATHIHARESVPLAWAIPLEGKREESGRFWFAFPTHTPTYLPGILNAPWKLNSDRNAIIGGEWNAELMRAAAKLVAKTLPKLSMTDDPGRVLDLFPRQMDRADDDAAPLVNELWRILDNSAVIPDAAGTPRPASELWRHPRDNPELAREWAALADSETLALAVHPSCTENRERVSRLNALAERLKPKVGEPQSPNLRKDDAASWFSDVASIALPQAIQVLKLAENYKAKCEGREWDSVRPLLEIIPSEDGQLLTAGQVVIAPAGVSVPDRSSVALALCDDAEAKRILVDVMEVKPLDESVWGEVLRQSLSGIPNYPVEAKDSGWRAFWTKLRSAPEAVRLSVIDGRKGQIRARRRDGAWVLADAVLLPGELVSGDDFSSNRDVLVDSEMHSEDGEALATLGVCEFPNGTVTGESDELSEWLSHCRDTYRRDHQTEARPRWYYLKPSEFTMPSGWRFLAKLTGLPNAKLTARFLARIAHGDFFDRLTFGHCTTPDHYPRGEVAHPLPWFVLKHGTVQVGDETVRLAAIVAKRHEPVLTKFPDWQTLLPTLEKLDGVDDASPPTLSDFRSLWLALIKNLGTFIALQDDSLRELWAGAAKDDVFPSSLRAAAGEVPLSQVFVTGSPDLARRARTPNRIVVTLDDAALTLWLDNGARNLSELITAAWTKEAGPADLLISVIPELTEVLRSEIMDTARCQPVTGLMLTIAEVCEAVPCIMWENVLMLDAEQLALLSRAERLKRLVNEVAAAGWLRCEPAEALKRLGDEGVDRRRADVARGATLAERLLLAVGGHEEPLQSALGDLAGRSFVQQLTPLRLAELTIAQLGPATLTVLKDTLAEEGLKPPPRWNTVEGRAFVASIGFPDEFASAPESRREAEEFISGPIALPTLHDFQDEVLKGIRELVASGTTRRRAVVSLPTGGGKTRVTVEAAVLLVLKPEGQRRSIVWVAQTDELCEQAVQAFRQVWLNLGAQKTDLRIVRLWGGNPSPTVQDPDKPIVVVASIQTLNSRIGDAALEWLQNPGILVVDECHHAITPSYTNLLRWLDAEAPRLGAPTNDEPPILGLSATPFRMDDDESQRLARRFDNRWFPAKQEELHARLLSQGVLSHVDHEALRSEAVLIEAELVQLGALDKWEGLDFENILKAINQRLAVDESRNQLLVDRIHHASERSILFFANSVKHAEEIAARLHLAGVPAAAVSGTTPTSARRYFLDRFQRGEIRVLCNHSVLTTGFDAPRTDMVLIARQVFSPVRYMQMVGRGLRGEKNGGTQRCRIVTVLDNLREFEGKHPFHYCERYFHGA
jgi:superfamily II DNA or RNA helicase